MLGFVRLNISSLPTPLLSLTYRKSGVNIDAGNELIQRIRPALESTSRSELISSVGGFAALANLPSRYENPVIVTGTDGVGTKLELATQFNRHRDVGFDLVGMCVNDVIVYGAEPFLFLDYFATGKLDVDVAEQVIAGIAAACRCIGCAVAGGETAEMPGLYTEGIYDLAGFCIGVVESDEIVDPKNVRDGDILIGLESNGPHSNGYSLIRKLLSNLGEANYPEQSILDQILAPTRIYSRAVQEVHSLVSGMAHITGGGFLENIPRILSPEQAAIIDLKAWLPHACFDWIRKESGISLAELFRTFNCGIAFVLATPPNNVDQALENLKRAGETPRIIGSIAESRKSVRKDELLVAKGRYKFG